MEDYLEKILEFLPETFFDKDSDDFIKYLSDAFIENSTNEKYQFAFTAFHMLNMVFIYKTKWFLFKQGNTIICTALENFRNNKNNNNGKVVFILDRWMISMLTYHPDNNLFEEYKIKDHYFWEFNWITPSKVILLERDPELSIANYDLNDKQEKQFLLEDSITKHKKKFKNLFEYLESAQSLTTELYNIQNSGSLDDLKKCIFSALDGEGNG